MNFLRDLVSPVWNAITSLPQAFSRRAFRVLINSYLQPFLLEKLELSAIEARLDEGASLELSNVLLSVDTLNSKLGCEKMGFSCRHGSVGKLSLTFPLDLELDDVQVQANDVLLVFSSALDTSLFRSHIDASASSSSLATSLNEQDQFANDGGDDGDDDFWESYEHMEQAISMLLANMKIGLERVRLVLLHKGAAVVLDLDVLQLYDNISIGEEEESHKLVRIGGFSCTIHQNAPDGDWEMLEDFFEGDFLHSQCCVASYEPNEAPAADLGSSGEFKLQELIDAQPDVVVFSEVAQGSTFNVYLRSSSVNLTFDAAAWATLASLSQVVEAEDSEEDLGNTMLSSFYGGAPTEFSMLFNASNRPGDLKVGESLIPAELLARSPLRFASVFSEWDLASALQGPETVICISKMSIQLRPEASSVGIVKGESLEIRQIQHSENTSRYSISLALCTLEQETTTIFSVGNVRVVAESLLEGAKAQLLVNVEKCDSVMLPLDVGVMTSYLDLFSSPTSKKIKKRRASKALSQYNISVKAPKVNLTLTTADTLDASGLVQSIDVHVSDAILTWQLIPYSRANFRCGNADVLACQGQVPLFRLKKGASLEVGPPVETSLPSVDDADSFSESALVFGWGADATGLVSIPEVDTTRIQFTMGIMELTVPLFLISPLRHLIISLLQTDATEVFQASLFVQASSHILVRFAEHEFFVSEGKLLVVTGRNGSDDNFATISGPVCRLMHRDSLMYMKLSAKLPAEEHAWLSANPITFTCSLLTISHSSVMNNSRTMITVQKGVIIPHVGNWLTLLSFLSDTSDAEETLGDPASADSVWTIISNVWSLVFQARSYPAHVVVDSPHLKSMLKVDKDGSSQGSFISNEIQAVIHPTDVFPLRRTSMIEESSQYRKFAVLQELSLSLAADPSLSVIALNFSGNPLEFSTQKDSFASLIGLMPLSVEEYLASISAAGNESEPAVLLMDPVEPTLPVPGKPASPVATPSSGTSYQNEIFVRLHLIDVREEAKMGSIIRMRWEYLRGSPTPYDWIGFYKASRSSKSLNYYGETHYVSGERAGVATFVVPKKMGFLHFRLYRSQSTENLAAISPMFRVGPLVELRVTRRPQQLFVEVVVVKNLPEYNWQPKDTDAIGIYTSRETNKNLPWRGKYQSTRGRKAVAFEIPEAGFYKFRYFADMGWGRTSELAISELIEITAADSSDYSITRRSPLDKPVLHCQLSMLDIRWTIKGGLAWPPLSVSGPVDPYERDHVDVELSIPGLHVARMAKREGKHYDLHVSARVGKFYVRDRVAESSYETVFCFPSVVGDQDSCLVVNLGRIGGTLTHFDLSVDFAPARLILDQDTMIFLLSFFFHVAHEAEDGGAALDSMTSFIQLGDVEQEEESTEEDEDEILEWEVDDGIVFDCISFGQLVVELNLKAKGKLVDRNLSLVMPKSLRRRKKVFRAFYLASGLFSVSESQALKLSAVLFRNLPMSQLVGKLEAEWVPELSASIPRLLSGWEPAKFVFRIGKASVSLVKDPLHSHRTGKGLAHGLRTGGAHFGKTVAVETFRGLSNLLIGTGNVLKGATELVSGGGAGATMRSSPINPKAMTPESFSQGMTRAGVEISKGFKEGLEGIIHRPVEVYQQEGGYEAFIEIVRNLPGLLLNPLRGGLYGAAMFPRAAMANLDPQIKTRSQFKYKQEEIKREEDESQM